jgi:hypothetical protein
MPSQQGAGNTKKSRAEARGAGTASPLRRPHPRRPGRKPVTTSQQVALNVHPWSARDIRIDVGIAGPKSASRLPTITLAEVPRRTGRWSATGTPVRAQPRGGSEERMRLARREGSRPTSPLVRRGVAPRAPALPRERRGGKEVAGDLDIGGSDQPKHWAFGFRPSPNLRDRNRRAPGYAAAQKILHYSHTKTRCQLAAPATASSTLSSPDHFT